METLRFREIGAEDAKTLAPLNAQLIRDEGHRNSMAEAQLAARMADWLRGEYRAVIFENAETVVGYALYRPESDHVYLRQLFVVPNFRRCGVGRQALKWLWRNHWTGVPRVRIDVLVGNTEAAAFWHRIGFKDYCITMEMGPPIDC